MRQGPQAGRVWSRSEKERIPMTISPQLKCLLCLLVAPVILFVLQGWSQPYLTSSESSIGSRAKDLLTLDMRRKRLRDFESSFQFESQQVFFRDYPPKTGKPKATVLLLHGARFSSLTWTRKTAKAAERTGTLEALRDAGIRGVALDLPGFAKNSAVKVVDRAQFLKSFIDYIGNVGVLVSPSASGGFALPYVEQHGTEIRGFVPVAPVGVSSFNPPQTVRAKLEVLAVVGENDGGGVAGLKTFRSLFKSYQQVIIAGGSHPAYLDDPKLWNTELIKFVERVAGTPK